MNNLEKRLDYLRRLLGKLSNCYINLDFPVVTELRCNLMRAVAADEVWLQGLQEAVKERRFRDYTNDIIDLCWNDESVIEFNDDTAISEIIVQRFVPTYRLVNPETLFGAEVSIWVEDKIQRVISTWAVGISTFDELLTAYSLRLDVDKETSWVDFGIVISLHGKRPIVMIEFDNILAWATFIYGGHYFTWALCPESIFRDKIPAKVAVEENSKLFREGVTDEHDAYDELYSLFRCDALLVTKVVLTNAELKSERIYETLLEVYRGLESSVDDCKKQHNELSMLVSNNESYEAATKRTVIRACATAIIISFVLNTISAIVVLFLFL